jgi:hypothetical protein
LLIVFSFAHRFLVCSSFSRLLIIFSSAHSPRMPFHISSFISRLLVFFSTPAYLVYQAAAAAETQRPRIDSITSAQGCIAGAVVTNDDGSSSVGLVDCPRTGKVTSSSGDGGGDINSSGSDVVLLTFSGANFGVWGASAPTVCQVSFTVFFFPISYFNS